ncbi:hypothetical protein Pst134EA_000894 [Puccinia striiformis f. sp. tritici]|uniref:hypothetical protein n=1 Tax=Puccinia striiformis f. sp. tritici TaxID=168172 RepID=UPI0020088408|nr:hypothetical protein Pst134EA_000894 [Puccinia striiformis f. sp. tritici]KAH9473831.1 hypothetical protein Pst134EA_000894 [Puccinia striiformis f. sp. tritici]
MFKAKTSILRAPLTYVMTLMLLHVQISEALLTPRPPGASVQHCGRALQLTFGKPLAPNVNTYSCTNYGGVRYRCADCNGGEELNDPVQTDFTRMRWTNCERSRDLRSPKASGVTVTQTKEFTTNRDKGRVELTGKEDGDAREHFYTCHWKTNHDFNGHRPYCRTCVLV